ncbi:MAG: DUF2318 domain-containing protein [Candidatus Omnitrophica bacterium]|nr:DUF2318 domain-containing protein [Candidatus Omnitrophota bacterium]
MFESFVIMLREGIEAALVIGIMMVVLKRAARRDLEHCVFWGIGLAAMASIGAAFALSRLPLNEEAYEGALYFISAIFVLSMMLWMRTKAKTLQAQIEKKVMDTVGSVARTNSKEAWGLGAFAFLMVFREGGEAVMFLSAVNLNTDAVLSFMGSLAGLILAVIFCVLFIQGSLHVNLRRFFTVTEWLLGIFVIQLFVNGYHEFSEAGILPATQASMAFVGPVVRNNSLFVLALLALPLFIWMTRSSGIRQSGGEIGGADARLFAAKARRERNYRYGAVFCALSVLFFVGIVYARELTPKTLSPPEPVTREGSSIVIPVAQIADGTLHRMGYSVGDRLVRFLAMKTGDGTYRTGLDACQICGSFGYNQEGKNLICLNCSAEIDPSTLGQPGGCNPLPLASTVTNGQLVIQLKLLEGEAFRFHAQSNKEK